MYARAASVPVGLAPGFCGYCAAPVTKTLGVSQTCPDLFTTELHGSEPMIAPPVMWVVWYTWIRYGSSAGAVNGIESGFIARRIPSALSAMNAYRFRSFSWKSNESRSNGCPHASV